MCGRVILNSISSLSVSALKQTRLYTTTVCTCASYLTLQHFNDSHRPSYSCLFCGSHNKQRFFFPSKHHWLLGVCNGDTVCFQWRSKWTLSVIYEITPCMKTVYVLLCLFSPTMCRHWVKFHIRVPYRNLSSSREFCENWCQDSYTYVTFCPHLP